MSTPTETKLGRPSLLSAELHAEIVDALENGATVEDTAESVGINRSTFFRWMQRGEEEETGEFRDFCDAVKKARAKARRELVKVVRKAADTQWTAAAWMLERSDPKAWSLRLRQMLEEELNGALDKLKRGLSPLEYARVIGLLAGTAGPAARSSDEGGPDSREADTPAS